MPEPISALNGPYVMGMLVSKVQLAMTEAAEASVAASASAQAAKAAPMFRQCMMFP